MRTKSVIAIVADELLAWGSYVTLSDRLRTYIVADIHGIWEYMSEDDRKAIFNDKPELLVERYMSSICIVTPNSDNSEHNAQVMTHLAETLFTTMDATRTLRSNTAFIVDTWRRRADGVTYV